VRTDPPNAFRELADELFALSPHIRYFALASGIMVQLRERPDLTDSSSAESDRYEELFVNPALLTLTRQRGELDCGGLDYVLAAYGSFFQLILPIGDGHASVAIEREADPLALVTSVGRLLERFHPA
jgi:hypothetical protein